MRLADLLPNGPPYQELKLDLQEGNLRMTLCVGSQGANCPRCGHKSKRVHSYYTRQVGDLPWAGLSMCLEVRVRKFFCRNSACAAKIFAERLGEGIKPYARRTKRCDEQLAALGLTCGGNAGARLAWFLGLPASASTVLRILHACPQTKAGGNYRVVGVDDWAFRKGHRYGTILVDLERGRVIDLLPDRESDTVRQWLEKHPGVEIVSRDRADAYATAAREGAPHAVQVADRWHLLRNMSNALNRMLNKHNRELREAAVELARIKRRQLDKKDGISVNRPASKQVPEIVQEIPSSKHEANFRIVKRLQKEGCTIRSMARQTGLHRQTIKKYLHYTNYPKSAISGTKAPKALPFEPYLSKRWEAGERNCKQLWREIVEQGFKGSFSSVYRLTRNFSGGGEKRKTVPPLEVRLWSARKVSFLLTKPDEKLEAEEAIFLKALYKTCPMAQKAAGLGKAFKTLSDKRQGKFLDAWLEEAKASGIAAFQNFATSLEQDYDAVKAGFTLEWSNGPVEGQVNRLKTIKRQMYGRASFSLLRKRVLFDSG